MHFERFLRSRKAQEGQTGEVPKAARGLLLGGMFVLVIVGIMMKSGTIFAVEGGQGTAEAFDKLVDAVRSVTNGSTNRTIVETFSMNDPDYIIVAFDSRPFAEDLCQRNENFWKPEQCGSKMCICICHEDYACENPLECKIIESQSMGEFASEPTKEFLQNLGATYEGDKAYVMIYDDCDGWGGEPLGVKDLLIEREGNVVRITDNACANKKFRGKAGQCTRKIGEQAKCAPGESSSTNDKYKCQEGFVCCI